MVLVTLLSNKKLYFVCFVLLFQLVVDLSDGVIVTLIV